MMSTASPIDFYLERGSTFDRQPPRGIQPHPAIQHCFARPEWCETGLRRIPAATSPPQPPLPGHHSQRTQQSFARPKTKIRVPGMVGPRVHFICYLPRHSWGWGWTVPPTSGRLRQTLRGVGVDQCSTSSSWGWGWTVPPTSGRLRRTLSPTFSEGITASAC